MKLNMQEDSEIFTPKSTSPLQSPSESQLQSPREQSSCSIPMQFSHESPDQTDTYSPAVRRAIARGKDAKRESIVATVQRAEENILAAIEEIKALLVPKKKKGPPYF